MLRRSTNDRVLLIGDFSTRHEVWGKQVSNESGRSLMKLVMETHIAWFATDTPTRYSADGKSSQQVFQSAVLNYYSVTDYVDSGFLM